MATKTVGQLFQEEEIDDKQYNVYPDLDQIITPGQKINLTKAPNYFESKESSRQLEPECRYVSHLYRGQTREIDPGRPKKERLIYKNIVGESGQKLRKKLIQRVLIDRGQAPINECGQAYSSGQPVPESERTALMLAAGIRSSDHVYASNIIFKESSWRPLAKNPRSTAYGLCQSMVSLHEPWLNQIGRDWRTNPITQLRWCNDYAQERYGGWAKAWDAWQAKTIGSW